jgi:hypothetical protein
MLAMAPDVELVDMSLAAQATRRTDHANKFHAELIALTDISNPKQTETRIEILLNLITSAETNLLADVLTRDKCKVLIKLFNLLKEAPLGSYEAVLQILTAIQPAILAAHFTSDVEAFYQLLKAERDMIKQLFKKAPSGDNVDTSTEEALVDDMQKYTKLIIVSLGQALTKEQVKNLGKKDDYSHLGEFHRFFCREKEFGIYLCEAIVEKTQGLTNKAVMEFLARENCIALKWLIESGTAQQARLVLPKLSNVFLWNTIIIELPYSEPNRPNIKTVLNNIAKRGEINAASLFCIRLLPGFAMLQIRRQHCWRLPYFHSTEISGYKLKFPQLDRDLFEQKEFPERHKADIRENFTEFLFYATQFVLYIDDDCKNALLPYLYLGSEALAETGGLRRSLINDAEFMEQQLIILIARTYIRLANSDKAASISVWKQRGEAIFFDKDKIAFLQRVSAANVNEFLTKLKQNNNSAYLDYLLYHHIQVLSAIVKLFELSPNPLSVSSVYQRELVTCDRLYGSQTKFFNVAFIRDITAQYADTEALTEFDPSIQYQEDAKQETTATAIPQTAPRQTH